MVAPRPSTGLRYKPLATGQAGLQYSPMSPWRSAGAGALQGLSGLLAALATGNPDQAAYAFQAGLQGQQEADYRREAADRDAELFQLRKDELSADRDEREQARAAAAQERAAFEAAIDGMNIPPDQKAFMKVMGPDSVDYGDLWPKVEGPDWQIKTVREGSQDVTYRINPATGEREKLGSGSAFAPKDGGGGLSIAAPVWGVDEAGNPVLLQMSPDGNAFQTVIPAGITPVRPNVQVDTGTGTAMVSPVTGQASTVIPKDVAGKQAQEEIGAASGKVAAGLPDAQAKAQEMSDLIAALKEHPGRAQATGLSSYVPTLAGSDAADFMARLDQLKGSVFLQAFNQLRGGGAITEMEGKKAEEAIARLNTAQSEKAFLESLDELDRVVQAGIARMKQRVGGGVTMPKQPTADDPLGILD